jgi:hypothetical protein
MPAAPQTRDIRGSTHIVRPLPGRAIDLSGLRTQLARRGFDSR